MCLILFAHDAHPEFRLILAANRDEYFSRPSAPAAFWHDAPGLLAGRDLDKGGTWLGITRSGRFAAVTNFRGAQPVAGGASRGVLATDFLRSRVSAPGFAEALATDASRYQGFNLLVGDGRTVCCYSNRDEDQPLGLTVAPGVHGLSNHLLDTPWPKVERGRRALESALTLSSEAREQVLVDALSDRMPPVDDALPATGVPIAFERALAAPFIHAPERDYGTRCTTLLTLSVDGRAEFVERTWDRQGTVTSLVRHRFELEDSLGD